MRGRRIEIKQTLLDKAIAWVAPTWGRARLQSRATMALASSWVGASKRRRATKEWAVTSGDADSDTLNDLPTLRERSRDLVRNNPIAGAAIATKVAGTVGTGLRLQSNPDRDVLGLSEDGAARLSRAIEREFSLWASSPNCDLERVCTFPDLQELAFRQTLENGDEFALLPMRDRGGPYQLCVQLVEADRVANKDHGPDTDTLRAGVEIDSDGAPTGYQIADRHPGFYGRFGKETTWTTVPAFGNRSGRRNVLHLYRKLRPGQSRGVPDLAPVIEPLKQLDRYTEAELMAAVVSAMFTVFIKSESGGLGADAPMEPKEEIGGTASDKDYKLGNGAIVELLPGEAIETTNPGRPNDKFDPFVNAILTQIGARLELPRDILVKHFDASYSAARASFLEAWKFYRGRRAWLARTFCQPIFETFFEEAVLRGRIAAPGFAAGDPAVRAAYLRAHWIGDAPGQIDEVKEVQAAKLRVDGNFSNLKRETALLTGEDWEQVNEQRRREMERQPNGGQSSQD